MFEPLVQTVSDMIILLEISSDKARARAEARDAHRSKAHYLDYKERLAQIYEVPYVARNRHKADIIIDNSDYLRPEVISVHQRI